MITWIRYSVYSYISLDADSFKLVVRRHLLCETKFHYAALAKVDYVWLGPNTHGFGYTCQIIRLKYTYQQSCPMANAVTRKLKITTGLESESIKTAPVNLS